jgi:hypothetical protein
MSCVDGLLDQVLHAVHQLDLEAILLFRKLDLQLLLQHLQDTFSDVGIASEEARENGRVDEVLKDQGGHDRIAFLRSHVRLDIVVGYCVVCCDIRPTFPVFGLDMNRGRHVRSVEKR